MTDPKHAPYVNFYNSPEHGVLAILYHLKDIGLYPLIRRPINEIRQFPQTWLARFLGDKRIGYLKDSDAWALHDISPLKDPVRFIDMYRASVSRKLELADFFAPAELKKIEKPFNHMKKLYIRDTWNPNVGKTSELMSVIESGFKEYDKFFGLVSDFFDCDKSKSVMNIAVVPSYGGWACGIYLYDDKKQSDNISLGYSPDPKIYQPINSMYTTIHETIHSYWAALMRFHSNLLPELSAMNEIIGNEIYSESYVNEAVTTAMQQIFMNGLYFKGKTTERNEIKYGWGRFLDLKNKAAVSMAIPDMFHNHIITILADDIYRGIRAQSKSSGLAHSREKIICDAVKKLPAAVPDIKELFDTVTKKNAR